MSNSPTPRRGALRIALLYVVVAALWILLSDTLVAKIFPDPVAYAQAQLFKGWFFVFITGLLLYGLTRRAFEALGRTELELRAALTSRDRFLSICSHELRTPLTALKLQLQLLEKAGRETPFNSFDIANRQTLRLQRLIADMLEVSRLHTGKMSLELTDTDMTALLEKVVEDFRAQASQQGSSIELSVDPGIRGESDPLRIEQVIGNLLSNAVKFGEGKPILVSLRREGPLTRLKIQDHGVGIAKADVDRVFNAFEQVESNHPTGGLGLGLFIVRQIVQLHHGNIRVQSIPGEGSIFTVDLPLSGRAPADRA